MINKPKVWGSTQESSLMGEIHIEMLNTNGSCTEGTLDAPWAGQQCSLCFKVNCQGPGNLQGCWECGTTQPRFVLQAEEVGRKKGRAGGKKQRRERGKDGGRREGGRTEGGTERGKDGREGRKVPDVTGSQCNLLRHHCYRIQET